MRKQVQQCDDVVGMPVKKVDDVIRPWPVAGAVALLERMLPRLSCHVAPVSKLRLLYTPYSVLEYSRSQSSVRSTANGIVAKIGYDTQAQVIASVHSQNMGRYMAVPYSR